MADTATVAAISAAIVAVISAGGSVWAAQAASSAQRDREREVGGEKWEDWKRGVYRRLLDAADGLSSIEESDPKAQERFDAFWADLRSAYNQLQLAAPHKVRKAALAFRDDWPKPGPGLPRRRRPGQTLS
jgi:hypothetical protein